MKKLFYISDFFKSDVRNGGAEIVDDILLNYFRQDGFEVVAFRNQELTDKHIQLYRKSGFHFLISNFTLMSDTVSDELVREPNSYSIMEHDHKYVMTRDPARYKDFLAPESDIVNREIYENAKYIFAQSKIQAECIKKNLNIDHVINLGMSLWSDEQLQIIESNLDNPKIDAAALLNSTNPTKNTMETIDHCNVKKIKYNLIGSVDYATFIKQLSEHSSYVFIPAVLESFNRVIVEARMLNCKIMSTNWNGCISESWFSKYKGKDLIEFAREQRSRVYDDIKNAILEKTASSARVCQSNVTVILNAYRRPYNLKMQIEAIRSQTIPPKHVWLWINAHEDNKGFDFDSLDVDRIFHNDYNWKFYGRFAAALLADTEYVALYDDDTVPGSKWHENCFNTMETHEGILGSAGIILKSKEYINHDRCGWPTQNNTINEVDLVGHSWFFKREWLRYLWQEKPTTWDNGEDIQFAFMAKIHGGIPTYCPPHPPDDKEMHGSILGNELGIDDKATSTNSSVSHEQFFSQRDVCVQAGLKKGWKTVKDIKV